MLFRSDVLVGNPPWLRYSKMTAAMKDRYKALAKPRNLLTGGLGASGRDLSTLFVTRAVEMYLNPDGAPVVNVSDLTSGVNKIEVPTGAIDRSRGDLHPLGNPHYWLDPENGRGIARAVAAKYTALDSAHSADYQKNLATFEAKLTQKEAEWSTKMAPLKGAAVVGYHSTFDYFIARYGMKLVGFVEPKPGIPQIGRAHV